MLAAGAAHRCACAGDEFALAESGSTRGRRTPVLWLPAADLADTDHERLLPPRYVPGRKDHGGGPSRSTEYTARSIPLRPKLRRPALTVTVGAHACP